MKRIEFKVFGNPVAQGRPRFFRKGDFVGCYDPKTSKSWKETIKWQAIETLSSKSGKYDPVVHITQGAITMTLNFILPRPKSLPKKVIHHIKKPDLDNLAKAVKDALKGIAYRDDSQIVSLIVTKEYGEQTGVMVTIMEI